jgi:hypothetical protein
MTNTALIDHVLAPAQNATPSERLVLKIAASLLKQIDPDYDIERDTDERIKLTHEEYECVPDRFELWNAIVRPKGWPIPEHLEAVHRERAEIEEIMKETGLSYGAALTEYLRRCEQRRKQSRSSP